MVRRRSPEGFCRPGTGLTRRTCLATISTPSWRPPSWTKPAIDRRIEGGAAQLDNVARARIYADVQKILAEDLPYLCLWHRHVNVARRDRVHGFRLTPGGDFYPLRDITLGPGACTAAG